MRVGDVGDQQRQHRVRPDGSALREQVGPVVQPPRHGLHVLAGAGADALGPGEGARHRRHGDSRLARDVLERDRRAPVIACRSSDSAMSGKVGKRLPCSTPSKRDDVTSGPAHPGTGSSGRSACSRYVLAVMQRTTFGVAGLDAADALRDQPARCRRSSSSRWRCTSPPSYPAGLAVDRLRLPRDARGQRRAAGRRAAPARRGARPAVTCRAGPGGRRRSATRWCSRRCSRSCRGGSRRAGYRCSSRSPHARSARAGALGGAVRVGCCTARAGRSAFGAAARPAPCWPASCSPWCGTRPRGVVVPRPAGTSVGRSSTACGRSGGARAPGWASSATWAPSSR